MRQHRARNLEIPRCPIAHLWSALRTSRNDSGEFTASSPWASSDEEWHAFLAEHDFGELIAPGVGRDLPIVVPTHFIYDGDKTVLLHLAKLANTRGCGRMEWSVLDWNEPAIAFYESLGARRMREWQICRLTGPALAKYA